MDSIAVSTVVSTVATVMVAVVVSSMAAVKAAIVAIVIVVIVIVMIIATRTYCNHTIVFFAGYVFEMEYQHVMPGKNTNNLILFIHNYNRI